MKEESLLLLSDLQKLINQVVLIDYTIIILAGDLVSCVFYHFKNTVENFFKKTLHSGRLINVPKNKTIFKDISYSCETGI